MNIKDMLKMCNYSFPLIIIRVNEELILKNDYERFIIPDNSKIQVIHLISGG